MATEKTYNGDGSDTTFDITFPYLTHADIGVSVGGVTKTVDTDYSITGNTVTFTTAPASGTANVKLYRNTNIDAPEHEYSAGSSITAARLNENQRQALYAIEEAKLVTTTSGGITTGEKNDIHVNSDTDWVIRTDAVEKSMMADNSVGTDQIETNAVTAAEIAANAVGASELADNAVDTAAIADNAVTMAKLNSGALPTDITVASANLVDATIATADIANSQITLAKLAAEVSNQLTPIGTVIWYAGTAAPTNYLICNGNAVPNGSGTIQSITADFSALYAVIGGFLPHIQDGHYIRGTTEGGGTGYFTTRQVMDWKSFNLKSINDGTDGTYTHETNMGKSTTSYLPTDGFFGGKYEQAANEISLKWDADGTSEIRPKSIILLPCIKYK